MKSALLLLVTGLVMVACNTKKTESTQTTDSLKVDSTIMADTPAPTSLAFSPVDGYSIKSSVALIDTVDFFLLTNQEDMDSKFAVDKTISEVAKPDFIINHIFAVVCTPSQKSTTIAVEKVEVGGDINVFVTIRRGEGQQTTAKPAKIFAIEKRDGYNAIQFFVNGQKSKALLVI